MVGMAIAVLTTAALIVEARRAARRMGMGLGAARALVVGGGYRRLPAPRRSR